MKVLIAPDKFKGSLTAQQFCEAACSGLQKVDREIDCLFHPLADGGEGTLDALAGSIDLKEVSLVVRDPLFRPIEASYMMDAEAAYIEMSRASGLQLLKSEERNCLKTTSFGTGELIRDAINRGAASIYLFIGGSATNDAAMGLSAALGYRFLDRSGHELDPVGGNLSQLHEIDDEGLVINSAEIKVTVVCDVKNPLFGPEGAAHIYAPQKGASPSEVEMLDQGLVNFNRVVQATYGIDLSSLEGGGAAGGIGAGAVGLLKARIQPGIESIMDITQFGTRLAEADMVITGEGKLDNQTLQGKVVEGVFQMAKARKKPLYIICGVAEDLDLVEARMDVPIYQLKTMDMPLAEAIKNAAQLVEQRSEEVMRHFHSTGK